MVNFAAIYIPSMCCWTGWSNEYCVEESGRSKSCMEEEHTEQGVPHPGKCSKGSWVGWHGRLCWPVYCMGGQAWEEPEHDVIWGPPPAIVSLSSSLGVHQSFYHREKQYILGCGFSFPKVSAQYNGSVCATGIDPVFDSDQRVQSFLLKEDYHGNNWCGLAELYIFLWRLNNTFIKVKNIFHLGSSQVFWFMINICFENIMRVVSLRIQEKGIGLKY